jgi:hypothetical protein
MRAIHRSFETLDAVNTSSRDPMDVDGKFLYEISLNAL